MPSAASASTRSTVLGTDFLRNPHLMGQLLAVEQPILAVRLPSGVQGRLVTRGEHCRAALSHPRLVRDPERTTWSLGATAGILGSPSDGHTTRLLVSHMLHADPDRHVGLRALVAEAFNVPNAPELPERIERIAEATLDTIPTPPATPGIDLLAEFARPFSLAVTGALLGLDHMACRELVQWTRVIVASRSGAALVHAGAQAWASVDRLIADRHVQPGPDLVSGLVHASVHGDRLSRDEIVTAVLLLVVASHDIAVGLIGTLTQAMLNEHGRPSADGPDAPPARLADRLQHLIQFDGSYPVADFRFVAAPVEIGGTVLQEDELLIISRLTGADAVTSAGRPQSGDTGAPGDALHRHLGIGLARLQARIGVEMLFTRHPAVTPAVEPDHLRWSDDPVRPGLTSLPVLLP